MSTYLLLLHETPADFALLTPAAMQEIVAAHRAYAVRLAERGLLAGGEKLSDDGGRHIRSRDGRPVITDGPYAETHEVIGGFYLVRAASLAEAEALALECPHRGGGRWIELRKVDEMQ
ncbi:YciI family protein [Piscinibacter defluvii]|uniref:YciI family protein n=1 Tax=Piscinibacter defluvii TaxID=1796922 RepID=UPI000FDD73A9|nr:YciI family protein [Piscinibacter defluvii]